MGCNTSASVAVAPGGDGKLLSSDPHHFSQSQRKIIKRTWKIMSSDLSGNGAKVFLKIFNINPKLKSLFPFGGKSDDELLYDPVFKGHASRFIQAVGAGVDNIGELNAEIGPLFVDLGKEHIHYNGFKPGYWGTFIEAMMFAWAQELGGKFTVDAQLTWKALFDFTVNKLKEGYAIALKDENARKNLTVQTVYQGQSNHG